MNGCYYHKKFLSYAKMNPHLVQFVPIASRLVHLVPCEKRASVILFAGLELYEYCDDPSLLHEKRHDSFLPCFLRGQVLQPFHHLHLGGEAMEGSVEAGITWGVLPGPSWGIPSLSDC